MMIELESKRRWIVMELIDLFANVLSNKELSPTDYVLKYVIKLMSAFVVNYFKMINKIDNWLPL